MKALSVRQPWAWLIVNGFKDIENRSWSTSIRGQVLIHASKTVDPEINFIRHVLAAETGIVIPDHLETGGVVGSVTITGCVTESENEWFEGPFGLTLDNAQPLPFTPAPGQLGFFDIRNFRTH